MSRVLKRIEFTLDPESIEAAAREIEKIADQLRNAMRALVERLMEEGVSHAKIEIATLNAVDTGSLMASIGMGAYDPQTRTGVVYAGGYHAFYVEFGTGVVGAGSPHPGIASGEIGSFSVMGENGNTYTKYGTYKHKNDGWVYMNDKGQFRWTKGYEARPFMYNTFKHLEQIAPREGADIIASYVY